MKHWNIVNPVAAIACSVKTTSLIWTGLTPPGWSSLYCSYKCNRERETGKSEEGEGEDREESLRNPSCSFNILVRLVRVKFRR